MGKIKVKGSAKMKFQAELLEIDITTRVAGKTSGIAIKNGKEQLEKLLYAMQEKLSIDPKNFELEDDHVSQGYNKDFYIFEKEISVTIKADLALFEQITDLISEFSDTSYHTHFKLDNIPEKERTVIQMALEDVRKKAEMIAECSNQVITGIDEILYEYRPPSEGRVGSAPARGLAKSIAVDLALPYEEISKEVNVIFLIEPKA